MNTDEILLKILEEQKTIGKRLDNIEGRLEEQNNEQKQIRKRLDKIEGRLDNMEVQLEEIRHDGKITRVATNRIGEMLEEHLLLENT